MSLARKILDEANEDISNTELYYIVHENVPIIIDGLNKLSKEFEYAHSDTEVQDIENLGITSKAVETLCNELDKNGFTYYKQPLDFKKKLLSSIFKNFVEFYEEYTGDFESDSLEILNTNSKDLFFILEKLKAE